MFRKTILSALTIAAIASAGAAVTTTSASAGGYGNQSNHGRHYKAPRHHGANWRAHVRWCYNRYNSYRDYDNSYQPYNGNRQQCWSPYYRG